MQHGFNYGLACELPWSHACNHRSPVASRARRIEAGGWPMGQFGDGDVRAYSRAYLLSCTDGTSGGRADGSIDQRRRRRGAA
jgi:hypothetical protein